MEDDQFYSVSEMRAKVLDWVRERYGVEPDYPFLSSPDAAVLKQTRAIRTCLKWHNFGAFRLVEGLQASALQTSSRQKSSKILHILRSKNFKEADFWVCKAQNAANTAVLASILT